MRKIFVVLCGLFLASAAFGAPDRYLEPLKSQFADHWLKGYTGGYSASLTGTYSDLSTQLEDKNKGINSHNGTHDDEGAVVLYLARNIYEHGIYLCSVQAQAANRNGWQYVWFDYYWKDDWTCKWLCEPGYSGSGCADTSLKCPSTGGTFVNTPKRAITGLPSIKDIENTKDTYKHTKEMEVLSFKNEEAGSSDEGVRQTGHIVLGVVGHVDYGVYVAPIKLVGERGKTGFGISSWIESVATNDQKTLLCKTGYVPNGNNTACVKNPSCDGTESYSWCTGFDTQFDQEKHKEEPDKIRKCKEYRCIEDNYGFTNDSNRDCVVCDTNIKGGINKKGVCEKCAVGKCFSAYFGECRDCTVISKFQMTRGKHHDSSDKECWRETDIDRFWGCVLCESDQPCWSKNIGCNSCSVK